MDSVEKYEILSNGVSIYMYVYVKNDDLTNFVTERYIPTDYISKNVLTNDGTITKLTQIKIEPIEDDVYRFSKTISTNCEEAFKLRF